MGDQTTDDSEQKHEPEEHKVPPAIARQGVLAKAVASRSMRWGTATAVYVLVVLAVLVAVNFVGSKIQTQWDLTANHLYTLTSASKQIVSKLPKPVQIIAFQQPSNANSAQVKLLLEQYQKYSNGKITYKIVNPVVDPALANEYGINATSSSSGTSSGPAIVVQSGSNRQVVAESSMVTYNSQGQPIFDGEGPITNAIIATASPLTYTVDFLQGDGEPNPTTVLPNASQDLTNQGYTVGTLNLYTTKSVPSSVSAIIIIDPTQDLAPTEIASLQAYAQAGGHFLVMLDPSVTALPNLDGMLTSWGVTPQNNIAIDTVNNYQGSQDIIIPTYPGASITNPLQQGNLATLLPGAQGLTIGKTTNTILPLLQTSSSSGSTPTSWGTALQQVLNSGTIPPYDAKTDTPGPINLAVTVEGPSSPNSSSTSATSATSSTSSTSSTATTSGVTLPKTFRGVVIGNAQFIASGSSSGGTPFITIAGNSDLFLNAVGWVTGRAEGIALRPHTATNTSVILNAATTRLLIDIFIFAVPIILLLLALGTYLSRRRL